MTSAERGSRLGQMQTPADKRAEDLADVCNLVLILLFQYILRTLAMGDT